MSKTSCCATPATTSAPTPCLDHCARRAARPAAVSRTDLRHQRRADRQYGAGSCPTLAARSEDAPGTSSFPLSRNCAPRPRRWPERRRTGHHAGTFQSIESTEILTQRWGAEVRQPPRYTGQGKAFAGAATCPGTRAASAWFVPDNRSMLHSTWRRGYWVAALSNGRQAAI
jgi:hypothetical protein